MGTSPPNSLPSTHFNHYPHATYSTHSISSLHSTSSTHSPLYPLPTLPMLHSTYPPLYLPSTLPTLHSTYSPIYLLSTLPTLHTTYSPLYLLSTLPTIHSPLYLLPSVQCFRSGSALNKTVCWVWILMCFWVPLLRILIQIQIEKSWDQDPKHCPFPTSQYPLPIPHSTSSTHSSLPSTHLHFDCQPLGGTEARGVGV